jgi:hypothetical protein
MHTMIMREIINLLLLTFTKKIHKPLDNTLNK